MATVVALSVYLRMPSKAYGGNPIRAAATARPGFRQDRLRLSPDGEKLALFTSDAAGKALWLRRFDSPSVEQLPGTEGAEDGVAWSPDSRYLLFVVAGKIKKTDIARRASSASVRHSGDVGGEFGSEQHRVAIALAPRRRSSICQ